MGTRLRSGSKEPPLPETALRVLLENPPPWLERTAEVSVLARCRAASALLAATACAASTSGEESVNIEEAIVGAGELLADAEMLSRHFLADDHPAGKTAKLALDRISGTASLEPSESLDSVAALN